MPALHFEPYDSLARTPNIVVDGAGNAATEITLSHWPKSGTARALKADTSAEIVFKYLASPAFHVRASAITNNHFDEDGLVGLFTLLEPEAAGAMEELIVGVAHAGDFGTYRNRDAARVAFTISAFVDPARSPLDQGLFRLSYAERTAALYRELLPRLGEILRHSDRFRDHWSAEDRFLADSERALAEGQVTIDEDPALDLAIVRLAETVNADAPLEAACHRMAIHNATDRNRLLLQRGRSYALAYRYESWVQVMTKPPLPRVDLAPLADALSAEEPGAAQWRFDGVAEITPRMTLSGAAESAIPPQTFAKLVAAFFSTAPPAWDPYDPA
ncbi:MAG: hypothetical protein Kilf2KO_36160 [Rhodospirillales bacterium]